MFCIDTVFAIPQCADLQIVATNYLSEEKTE